MDNEGNKSCDTVYYFQRDGSFPPSNVYSQTVLYSSRGDCVLDISDKNVILNSKSLNQWLQGDYNFRKFIKGTEINGLPATKLYP